MRKVRIKVSANIVYELTNFGNIKAGHMFDELRKNVHIEKKIGNVVDSIENLLYDGHVITKAEYDMLTNEVVLYLGGEYNGQKDGNVEEVASIS